MNKLYIISTNHLHMKGIGPIMKEFKNYNISYEHLNYQWVQSDELKLSELIDFFSNDIQNENMKNVFIYGDNWEALILATIATYYDLKVFYYNNGYGKYSKAISQLVDYHFVLSNDVYDQLLLQGVNWKNIFIVGSPLLDNINDLRKLNCKNKTGLIIYNPVKNAYKEINDLLDSLRYFEINYIIYYPENNKDSEIVLNELNNFICPEVRIKKKLKFERYYDILNSVDILISNSIDSLIESASFKLPTVFISNNFECNNNVIFTECNTGMIVDAIKQALELNCDGFNKFTNNASNKIAYEITKILSGSIRDSENGQFIGV